MTTEIKVSGPPKKIVRAIIDVISWWSKDFEGACQHMRDEFIIHHPKQHDSKQKVVELEAGKKMVGLVTESKLHWLTNGEEWTNTTMVFEIVHKGVETILQFTPEGLTPDLDCYNLCTQSGHIVVDDWLHYLIEHGSPSPDMQKAAEIRAKSFTENNQ